MWVNVVVVFFFFSWIFGELGSVRPVSPWSSLKEAYF